ncbi:transcriptional repressor LexA [Peptoniphilus sp. GNH]|nr:transcriptional repressor LexA [Peptoniphilus sp. GNH]
MKTNDLISKNLQYYMDKHSINNKELSEIVGVSESTVGKWLLKKATPRMGAIEKLSDYFKIQKSDLLEEKEQIDLLNIPGIIPIKKLKKIPILGTIACGDPILAVENIDDYFSVDADIVTGDFALRCKGNSMIEANIFEGDIVFFKETPIVENGQIAAVVIDEEATLKKFFKTNSSIILQPCNENYNPIILTENDHKDIRIIGLMVGVYSKRNK